MMLAFCPISHHFHRKGVNKKMLSWSEKEKMSQMSSQESVGDQILN